MVKLIEPIPAPEEDNVLKQAGRFLREHEEWLIRLQAIKDSYEDQEAYKNADWMDGTRELLEASKIIIGLISLVAVIQAERLSDLVELLDTEDREQAIENLEKSRGDK